MRVLSRLVLPTLALILAAASGLPGPARADAPASGPVPAPEADFRAARWGMTPRQVQQAEAAPPVVADGPLMVFPATVGGHPCRVVYFFEDDRLRMGFYQWSGAHDDLAAYFVTAESLRGAISAVYDEPPIERWDWEDPMFADDPELRAEALGLGLVRYELGWMSERSIVALRLAGGNLEGDIVVMYADRRGFARGQDAFGAFFADRVGMPSPYYR